MLKEETKKLLTFMVDVAQRAKVPGTDDPKLCVACLINEGAMEGQDCEANREEAEKFVAGLMGYM